MPMQVEPRRRGIWSVLFVISVIAASLGVVFGPRPGHWIAFRIHQIAEAGELPEFSPDGRWIAYYDTVDSGSNIHVKAVAGRTRLDPIPAQVGNYQWISPSGESGPSVLILTADRSHRRLYRFDPDTRKLTPIQSGLRGDRWLVSFTHDGSARCELIPRGRSYIVLINRHGVNAVDLSGPKEYAGKGDAKSYPLWSADDRYVAWIARGRICVYDCRAHKLQRYALASGYPGNYAMWHPRRSLIAYEIWDSNPNNSPDTLDDQSCIGLGVMDVTTGRQAVIYRGVGESLSPVWHPSGDVIACVSHVPRPLLIDARDPFRADRRPQYCHTYPQSSDDECKGQGYFDYLNVWLSWSPDGKRLTYGHGRGVVTFEFDAPNGRLVDIWR
jgi:hypothetical protein